MNEAPEKRTGPIDPKNWHAERAELKATLHLPSRIKKARQRKIFKRMANQILIKAGFNRKSRQMIRGKAARPG